MQLNDQTNYSGIVQMIENTTGLGIGKINDGTAYASMTASQKQMWNQFLVMINNWYQAVAYWIWMVDKNWHYDDSNYSSDLPIGYATLVDGQRDYVLPAVLRKIEQVEVKDKSGKYYTLNMMRRQDYRLRNEKFQETAGAPTDYYKIGRSLMLYPTVDENEVTVAAGLRVTFDRRVELFETTDTTKEPGFDKQFHPILYYGPSFEWAMTHKREDVAGVCNRMLGNFPGLLESVQKFYSDTDESDILILNRAKKSYR